jgi:serine/threonine protein kinase
VPDAMLPDDLVLPLDVRIHIDQVCLRFEEDWKSGSKPELAPYLAGTDSSQVSQLLCELLKVELHYRKLFREDKPIEDYLSQFPEEEEAVQAAFSSVMSPTIPQLGETPQAAGVATLGPVSWPVLSGYQILGVVGKGGMGVVYKAEQVGLKRVVALKMILHADHSTPEMRARFHREAESLAHVKHQHIVEIHDIGESNGTPYYSMEFVEGGSLNHYLDGKPLPPLFAAKLVETLARAVHVAHQSGVVHRDLKPANILLAFDRIQNPGQSGEKRALEWWRQSFVPKITDFGLAKKTGETVHTLSGVVLGTPSYMAPEQALASSEHIGPATDVYALGAVLYELLCGRPPVKASTPMDALYQVLKEPPKQLRKPDLAISRELEAVCLKCLERNPASRYASAEDLADDLLRWQRGEATVARPLSWPSRIWRWSHKHPRVSLALVLAPLVAIAAWAGIYFTDPQRNLESIETRLGNGEAVTLIGETRGPKWSTWATGKGGSQKSVADDGVFSIHSWTLGMLELVHRPPPTYTLNAEVKHDKSDQGGDVGLFFALNEVHTNDGILQLCYQLAFNDIVDRRVPPDVPQQNVVLIRSLLSLKSELDSPLSHTENGKVGRHFKPAGQFGSGWRKLSVKVGPDSIEMFWDGQQAGTLDRAELNDMAAKTKNSVGLAFNPAGSLGLYVFRGSASFRRVVIEPRHGN